MATKRTIIENIDEVVESITQPATTATATQEVKKEEPVIVVATETGDVSHETKKDEVKAVSFDDLTEDQLMELATKKGFSISKKNEELSPEAKLKLEQMEEVEKLTFAVQNNLITPERYQELKSIINEDGLELTKKEFIKAYKAENKDASEKDIAAAYTDYYNLNEEVEVKEGEEEFEKTEPKYNERQVKWGQSRQQTKAERIKESAKTVLDQIDTNYKNYKSFQSKANDYGKNVESVISEISTDKYEVGLKKGKEVVNVSISLPKDAKEKLNDYLINKIGGAVLQSNDKVTKEQVKELSHSFIRSNYEDEIMDKYYEVAKSEGLREGAVGSNAPIIQQTFVATGEDEEQKKIVENAIPDALKGINLSRNKNKS